jgi:hydrogenase maturation protein HypF
MCPQCQQEYTDPTSRRFHAEPNACPVCGPQLTLTAATGPLVNTHDHALRAAARLLEHGYILAVQGIGGYHLMCNATHEPVVAALRQRKHRDEKPLAVMFRDLAQLRTQAEISPTAAALLTSSAAPIVLVPKLSGAVTGP